MNTNIRESELLDAGVALDEPHFDEESTVLSARPVVPLEAVARPALSAKGWGVALIIVVALLIGAFGAVLIYKLRTDSANNIAEVENQTAVVPPSLEAGVAGVATNDTESKPEPKVLAAAVPKKPLPPVVSKGPAANVTRRPQRSQRESENWDDEIARREMEKEARRAEKREKRRARRAERETRQNGDRRSDDLLRIREIFEGSPRPW